MMFINKESQIGIALASHLGLGEYQRVGHDLAGPCVVCKSSDAFHLHQQTGVAHCFSCDVKWSPFQLAEHVLGDREQAKQVMVTIGAFKPSYETTQKGSSASVPDPVEMIARQKISLPRFADRLRRQTAHGRLDPIAGVWTGRRAVHELSPQG